MKEAHALVEIRDLRVVGTQCLCGLAASKAGGDAYPHRQIIGSEAEDAKSKMAW